MDLHNIHTAAGPVEYTDIGAGLPVLFLHGGHANARDTLAHKGLDPGRFRLITPSRPGYGKTPLNGHGAPRQAAALMVALLDALGIDRVAVYGISAGGPVAVELAAGFPDRVSRLVLASAVTREWMGPDHPDYRKARRLFHPRVQAWTWRLVRFFSRLFPGQLTASFQHEFSSKPGAKPGRDETGEFLATLRGYGSGTGFLNDLDHPPPAPETLRRIGCATLIVHSLHDKSVPVAHARHAAGLIPNSRLELIDNDWGHLIWLGRGSEIALESIADFLGDAA